MRLSKTALLGGVAALALGVGTAGFGVEAEAFDEVHWHWDKHINEVVTKNINIDINIAPVGDITDQVLQMQIGDVRANSSTHSIKNLSPLEQVEWKEGWRNRSGLTVDGGFYYDISGGGKSTSAKSEALRTVNRTRVNNSTNTTYATTDKWGGQIDGQVNTKSENGPAGFIGGAGFATGGLTIEGGATFPPLAGSAKTEGAGSGPFVIAGIGGAALNGDASFDADLNTKTTTKGSASKTEVVDNQTIIDSTFSGSKSNEYTYAYNGEGVGGFNYAATSYDITTYFALAPKVQNALNELPEVIDQATAIGNLISVNSDVAVQEHSGQFLFDTVKNRRVCKSEICEPGPVAKVNFEDADFDLDADLDLNDRKKNLHTQNHFHDLALLFGLAAGAGLIEQAEISAKSEVYDIYQATGSASASAFGNLKSITVDTNNPNNGLVIADVTQLSVANVNARATAHGITVVNYTNLGKLDRAIAQSTATAIGNTLNISVDSGQNNGGGGNP